MARLHCIPRRKRSGLGYCRAEPFQSKQGQPQRSQNEHVPKGTWSQSRQRGFAACILETGLRDMGVSVCSKRKAFCHNAHGGLQYLDFTARMGHGFEETAWINQALGWIYQFETDEFRQFHVYSMSQGVWGLYQYIEQGGSEVTNEAQSCI